VSTRPERRRPRRAAAARSDVRGGQQLADLVAGIAGVVLLISMFLPWFGPGATLEEAIERANEITLQAGGEPQASPDVTDNAWQAFSFVDLVLLLTALAGIRAGVAAVARQGSGRAMIGATAITAGLGGVSSLLVLYRVINPIGEAGREYGLFIGFFAALGVAVGGWLALERDSRGQPRRDSSE
jgi:hypothetical protein